MNDYLPLVGIVTLIYNNEKFIVESIKSIINQTYPISKIEHIIINDFSPGDDNEIKTWIKNNNYKCKYIEHKKNLGICRSLNEFILVTKSKYFFGLADDLISPSYIFERVKFMEQSNSDIAAIYSPAICINNNNLEVNRIDNLPKEAIFKRIITTNYINAVGCFRRVNSIKEVGLYDERLYYEDYDMWLRLLVKFKIILFKPDKIDIFRRVHESSTSFNLKNDLQLIVKLKALVKHRKFNHNIIIENMHIFARKLSISSRMQGIKWLFLCNIIKPSKMSFIYFFSCFLPLRKLILKKWGNF